MDGVFRVLALRMVNGESRHSRTHCRKLFKEGTTEVNLLTISKWVEPITPEALLAKDWNIFIG